MDNLDKLIKFWKSILDDKDSRELSDNVLNHIVLTVASLEELRSLKAA